MYQIYPLCVLVVRCNICKVIIKSIFYKVPSQHQEWAQKKGFTSPVLDPLSSISHHLLQLRPALAARGNWPWSGLLQTANANVHATIKGEENRKGILEFFQSIWDSTERTERSQVREGEGIIKDPLRRLPPLFQMARRALYLASLWWAVTGVWKSTWILMTDIPPRPQRPPFEGYRHAAAVGGWGKRLRFQPPAATFISPPPTCVTSDQRLFRPAALSDDWMYRLTELGSLFCCGVTQTKKKRRRWDLKIKTSPRRSSATNLLAPPPRWL